MEKHFIKILLMLLVLTFFSCRPKLTVNQENKRGMQELFPDGNVINIKNDILKIDDTTFVDLKKYSQNFVYDMKYATEDNFLKAKVYDCDVCYLRLKTVKAMIIANQKFLKKGYRIKIFDCYRPLDIQEKMWKIVPDPTYVANPKKGSIHNRGGAIDITLVDKNNTELDMGTAFDYFGAESGHNYQKLSSKVKANRRLLKKIMLASNFKSFDSEWWHYNLKNSQSDKVSNFKWNCD